MKETEVIIVDGVITLIPQLELGTKFYFMGHGSVQTGEVSSYNIKIISTIVGQHDTYSWNTWFTYWKNNITKYFHWVKYPKSNEELYIKYNYVTHMYEDEGVLLCINGIWYKDSHNTRIYFDKNELIETL